MEIQLPTTGKLRHYLGSTKREVERVADRAVMYRNDDATQRLLDNEWHRRERVRFTDLGVSLGTKLGVDLGVDLNSMFAMFRQGFLPGDSLFDADYYALDPGTGKVKDWVDYIDPTHALRQLTPSSQCSIPTTDAEMTSALTYLFSGAQSYISTRPASFWKILHDGSGCSLTAVLRATVYSGFWWLTTNGGGGATDTGAYIFVNSTPLAAYNIRNSGVSVAGGSAGITPPSAGTALRSEFSLASGNGRRFAVNGTVATSAVGALSNGDPLATLNVGTALSGAYRLLLHHSRDISGAQRVLENEFIQLTTGIAA